MSTTYVGMSTPEGTCEAVEVDLLRTRLTVKSESSLDKFVLVVGSVSGMTAPDPEACRRDFLYAAAGTTFVLGQIVSVGLATVGALEFKKDVTKLVAIESFAFVTFGIETALLEKIVKPGSQLWTGVKEPEGILALWVRAWNSCGRPGGGLMEKIKEWKWNPLRLPKLQIVPIANRVPVSEPSPFRFSLPEIDFQLPEISPDAIRNAAMTTATLVVIGGVMILLAPVGI